MKWLVCKRFVLTTTLVLATAPATAAPKPLISYFEPMPIVGKLSTTVWGAATVGKRDPANGLEDDGESGGVGPQQETYFYWDGKILKGGDGKYHMYASRWLHQNGFGPPVDAAGTGWEQSIPMQAISDSVLGPYVTQGTCYTQNQEGNDQGHNTTALITPTGTSPYTLSIGETVPGQMFSASSANGPWTSLGLTQTDTNGHSGCGLLSSNFTFTVGPDQRFWATSRGGCVMDSDQVLGTYKVETDSVLPNLENNDNGNAEDQVIWYSGGYYHIVYNYWNVQRGYHIMSKDGKTKWTSTGLAYQGTQTPSNSNSKWLRYTDGTVNTWHNMERASVYLENGHVAYFTFAVTDVDKNANGVNMGGAKVLVVPFNGVQFDCDNGDAASCTESAGGTGGTGGAGGAGGSSAGAGSSGASTAGATHGGTGGASNGVAGEGASGDTAGVASGGTAGESTGGTPGASGDTSGGTGDTSGGAATSAGSGAGTPGTTTGGIFGSGGASPQTGSAGETISTSAGGSTSPGATASGCSCRIGNRGSNRALAACFTLFVAAGLATRRRRRRMGAV